MVTFILNINNVIQTTQSKVVREEVKIVETKKYHVMNDSFIYLLFYLCLLCIYFNSPANWKKYNYNFNKKV